MSLSHYRLDESIRPATQDAYNEYLKLNARARAMSVKCGGNPLHFYFSRHLNRYRVTGFIFETPPGKQEWCRLGATPDGWRPKRTARQLDKQFRTLQSDFLLQLLTLVEVSPIQPGGRVISPGVLAHAGDIYLQLPDYTRPTHCERFSPEEFAKIPVDE